jgi:hypothetical protein
MSHDWSSDWYKIGIKMIIMNSLISDLAFDVAEEDTTGFQPADEDLHEDFSTLTEALEEEATEKVSKAKRNSSSTRQVWSEEEENEIRKLFAEFFANRVRPKPCDVAQKMKQSCKQRGIIHNRGKDVLKKKVFRMIDKA